MGIFNFLGNKKNKLVDEANQYVSNIKLNKKLPVIKSDLFLKENEHVFLEDLSTMNETRAIRKSVGGFGGIRVAKGLTVGGYSGTSESHQEWRSIDSGKLSLSNSRLIFNGNKGNKIIEISNIVSIEVLKDGIQMSLDNKSKDILFTVNNPYIWGLVMNIIRQVQDPLHIESIDLNVQFK